MFRRNPVASLFLAVILFAAIDLALLISGRRILLTEKRETLWMPEMKFEAPQILSDSLDCKYFTGRSIKTTRFYISDGRPDECPFVLSPEN